MGTGFGEKKLEVGLAGHPDYTGPEALGTTDPITDPSRALETSQVPISGNRGDGVMPFQSRAPGKEVLAGVTGPYSAVKAAHTDMLSADREVSGDMGDVEKPKPIEDQPGAQLAILGDALPAVVKGPISDDEVAGYFKRRDSKHGNVTPIDPHALRPEAERQSQDMLRQHLLPPLSDSAMAEEVLLVASRVHAFSAYNAGIKAVQSVRRGLQRVAPGRLPHEIIAETNDRLNKHVDESAKAGVSNVIDVSYTPEEATVEAFRSIGVRAAKDPLDGQMYVMGEHVVEVLEPDAERELSELNLQAVSGLIAHTTEYRQLLSPSGRPIGHTHETVFVAKDEKGRTFVAAFKPGWLRAAGHTDMAPVPVDEPKHLSENSALSTAHQETGGAHAVPNLAETSPGIRGNVRSPAAGIGLADASKPMC